MPRGGQIIRQWRILRLLEQHAAGLTARELWDAVERDSTERTIFRDLENLQAAGFPLASDDGRWRLLDSPRRTHVPLTESDMLALLLSEDVLGPSRDHPAAEALASLREKLVPLLTPTRRRFVEEMRRTQAAGHTTTARPDPDGRVAELIHDAIAKQQTVRLRYRSPRGPNPEGGVTERRFDPYAHLIVDGRAYVIGHCHLRDKQLPLLLARIDSAELTDDTFDPPPDFDAARVARDGFGAWIGDVEPVRLLFSPPAAHLARERAFGEDDHLEPLPDGAARLTCSVAGLPPLARWIAGTGGAVRAEHPAELARMVRDIHRDGLAAEGLEPPSIKPLARAEATKAQPSAEPASGSD